MKKCILFFVLVLFIWLTSTATCHAQVLVDHAKAGKSATWTLTDDGVLTIEGTGEVNQINSNLIWENLDLVKALVIRDGITCISDDKLGSLYKVSYIKLPKSLVKLKLGTFSGCSS